MSHKLHNAKVIASLEPRREPYWSAPLARGRFLGLRKIDAERGSWIARLRDERGRQKYRSLGYLTERFEFEEAGAAANAWFKAFDAGVDDTGATVEKACREYVDHLRRHKRESAAKDADMRFRRTVYGSEKRPRIRPRPANAIASVPLDKLRKHHVAKWRDDLKLGAGASNRTLTALKAALNLAVSDHRVSADRQIEWASVKRQKDTGRRRDLFLDLRQRRKLLDKVQGATRDLIEAAALTGARAGELIGATRRQFDARTASMTLQGKAGTRTVPLSPAALALFKRLARSKLPDAPLLTRDDGKPWSHSDWDALVREAAERAKLPKGVCLYTLRHSFITQTLLDGVTTLEVARLVGTSLQMIEKHYGHLAASTARDRLAAVTLL
jgi:integrase